MLRRPKLCLPWPCHPPRLAASPPPPPDPHHHHLEPRAHPPRLPPRPFPEPTPALLRVGAGVAGDEGEYVDREVEEDGDERYEFEMEVRKLPGKKNHRLVRARVRVGAPLQAVWATLTDYEGLAGFIPGLSECRRLHQDKAFARLYQVGEQDLALGFKFNAKGTIECYEGEMELLPDSRARRREIDFNMVDGDFKVFQGKWSVQEPTPRKHCTCRPWMESRIGCTCSKQAYWRRLFRCCHRRF